MRPINNEDFFDIMDEANTDIKDEVDKAVGYLRDTVGFLLYLRNKIDSIGRLVKGIETDIICLLFISKLIEIIDCISVLTEASCLEQVEDELRILLENCVSLRYIINSGDSEKCARAYYLDDKINAKKKYEQFIKDDYFNQESFKTLLKSDENELKQMIAELDKDISEEYNSLFGDWKENKSWYQNLGIVNFRELCKEVNLLKNSEKVYLDFYKSFSRGIHAKSVVDMCNCSNGELVFKKIRSPEKLHFIYFIYALINDTCLDVISNYLKDDFEVQKQYKEYVEKSRSVVILYK